MSEQTIQNDLYTENISILDKYICLSLGATTIRDLFLTKKINIPAMPKHSNKKPDVLIIDKDKTPILYLEFKKPEELNTIEKLEKAIKQELLPAQEIDAKIYVISDGDNFYWINPLTENYILFPNKKPVLRTIKPKQEDGKELAEFIDLVRFSINANNDVIQEMVNIDPTDLAKKINKILKRMTFASSKLSLYTFVEIFLFKYLSDIQILKDENSFEYIYKLYAEGKSEADVLGKYLDGPRETMKQLFPPAADGTTIINGKVFHAQKIEGVYVCPDSTDTIFKNVLTEFKKYEIENGKFISISKDFKSKLFETFMKNSDDKNDMGQFFTPLKVVDEMVRMVNIKAGDKICDPACGVGKFLLEAVKECGNAFKIENGHLVKNITIKGFEKKMSEEEDITTILAKANTLIYFSKLFTDNNNTETIKNIAKELLNDTYYSSNTILGTLDSLKEEEYDVILANPPYYQDGEIAKQAKNTGYYTANGKGLEGIFTEWIVKSLKPNGTANIVLPYGIFANDKNKKLREFIMNSCVINAIISLPKNTFFNTDVKTYILNIRKKSCEEIKKGVSDYKVFMYICNSIGETLDVYRFNQEDNDLHEAVNKYNYYKDLEDKENIQSPFKEWIKEDKKLKLISFSELSDSLTWETESFWSIKELQEIGVKDIETTLSISQFKVASNVMLERLNILNNKISWLCCDNSDSTFKECGFKDIATIKTVSIGMNQNQLNEIKSDEENGIPVYSAAKDVITYIPNIDETKLVKATAKNPVLTIASNGDGSAGRNLILHTNNFYIASGRLVIKPNENVNIQYLKHLLRNIKKTYGYDRAHPFNEKSSQKINLMMPVFSNGEYDVDKQIQIAKLYTEIENIKNEISKTVADFFEYDVDIIKNDEDKA